MTLDRRVVFTRSAVRDLERLPRDMQMRFRRAFDRLAENPTTPRPGLDIRPLKGGEGTWRLRVGEYRATYDFDEIRVRILELGHRSNFY